MEQRLSEAAQSGEISELYELLRLDPTILDKYDEPSFVDTPAHIAAAAGSSHFAIEVLSLKPSFGSKLNPDGYSPLDLALQSEQHQTVKRLVKYDPELIRVKGRERLTPLHHVAQVGDADLLAYFLLLCPKSIQDLTIRGETAVHIAVRYIKVRALRVLLGWLEIAENEQILNWKDENGDTALHIAASTNNFEVVRLLISEVKRLKTINAKNLEGLTCLDTFLGLAIRGDERIAKALRDAGAKRSSSLRPSDNLADILSLNPGRMLDFYAALNDVSSETRNALLVVAVLFVTATYSAVLKPPGGISSAGDTILSFQNSCNISSSSSFSGNNTTIYTSNGATGKAQMDGELFPSFITLNTALFVISLRVIFLLLPRPLSLYMGIFGVCLLANYLLSVAIISPERSFSQVFANVFMILILHMISMLFKNQDLNPLHRPDLYM
ncbi:ankyrin repeat-containing protein BDA1-like [Coffea eugenioides]|uniref:Ankyrin repeat-containing protein BDA1-like isoform X1 n=2 Tax=Coffea arabica TaxID=13443 RepID=A0A6P6STF5_COFAR|nr:ankyrin repeat-containing protein BDA1-like [Coffea arabica]XP_027171795.1 ankyrin repeat-containing protein BDA1-like [Coffea eugenioides]